MAPRQYLLTAGPTPVPERVALAMARPMIYHRGAAFTDLLNEVVAGLKRVFQTNGPVLILAGSGTAGMEAAISNFLSPGDKALCIVGGRFGQRWCKMVAAFGVEAIPLEVEWGRAVDPRQVMAALEREPRIRAVYATASESSTGVAHPLREIGELCAGRDAIFVVDAISALGAFDVPQDRWGIDVLLGASQKALMLPPGMAFVGVSDKAWGFARSARCPRFYLDLQRQRASQDKGETPWTPPVSLLFGLRESLGMILEEGLERVFARHQRLAEATRRGCVAMGCPLFAVESPSPSITAARVPPGVDGSALVKHLAARYGIIISGGQEQLKGKIIRIAHMGYFTGFEILNALAAVEMALADLGHPLDLGTGLRAAEQALQEAS